ncbi:Tetratricopeptide-like helical [Artemisia annua]|uniref:Tetratricopeptide-like helical n=1 Tax=Artemisia annua TaxID=35608 RepID=A0A2U1Q4Z6_ARTAN|nr:Tetratricopeptide-like helical [Artemisia annua]
MLCACSGEQFKVEEPVSRSPESLATRDFSASGLSSRTGTGTGEWDSRFEDAQVDEAESTLKEALSLNYEEARALLGRLEYQRGNFDAALQVFYGIDIKSLSPRMIKAISYRSVQRNLKSKREINGVVGVMSLHSVSLLLEAILLKAKSLQEMGKFKEAAKECKMILDIVESALPNGIPESIAEDCKLQEMFHKALELLPKLWIEAAVLNEAIIAYRRALVKPWNLDPQRLSTLQKDLAALLLYGGVEATLPEAKPWDPSYPNSNTEEALLLLFILMGKVSRGEIRWDPEIISHLTFALSTCGQYECLAVHVEQLLPGVYKRTERWHFLALCYSAAGQLETAISILNKISGSSESEHEPYIPSLLLGAKLCSQDPNHSHEGINYARKVIELGGINDAHFQSIAHKFLGTCYGNAARVSLSDSERVLYNEECLDALNKSVSYGLTDDPEAMFNLGLENAIQRNLDTAFNNVMLYSDMVVGSSAKGFKLLALIVSAEQRFGDAETIVDFGLDETGKMDQLELLRLKAVLQIARGKPKQAIETYRVLLALIRAQGELLKENLGFEDTQGKLELEAWLDLADIYSKLESFSDAELCVGKVKSKGFYHPRAWHSTGLLFDAQSLHNEALVAFSVSLSIEPDYVPSIISTAETLMKMGGAETLPIAKSFFMNTLRLEPTNHDAWFKLGMICKKEGLVQQAAEFFQAAHELKISAPVQSFV